MNLSSVSLSQWRKSCAAVLQDGRIYNDTILNNIALEDDNIDYEKLKEAVKIANIEQEIVTLPLSYQTRISETGRWLSHGQKQRILLARAIYQNPQFLILDEATNALDSENEDIILTHLETFFENRTVVIAARSPPQYFQTSQPDHSPTKWASSRKWKT
jgi:ATP-binding cassette, subfamily B, bacterial